MTTNDKPDRIVRKKNTGEPTPNKGQFGSHANSAPEGALEKPAAYLPGTIGGYSLKHYKKHRGGMEGGAFSADLYKDGKKVFVVTNDGNGGDNRFADPKTGGFAGLTAEYKEFTDLARKAMKEPAEGRFDTGVFIGYLAMVGDMQTLAEADGRSYQDIASEWVDLAGWVPDEDKDLLLHPEFFQA